MNQTITTSTSTAILNLDWTVNLSLFFL